MSAIKKNGNYLGKRIVEDEILRSFAYTDLSNVSNEIVFEKVKVLDGEGSGLDADLIRGLPGDFSCSKSQNGWMKFPNGIIIQWGKSWVQAEGSHTGVSRYVTFPIKFPHAVFCVVSVPIGSGSGGGKNDYWGVTNVSTTGFKQWQQYNAAHYFYWIAIGW